ncbi:T9SS type A sorting domain-containing protein [Flavobacterium sp.]|uniref:T9SS type A sorting domain-containing protein n=2 Tax=Flavobacterium sp. TaxID=239 RepID=UPI0040478F15
MNKILFLLLITSFSYAQTISKQVIGSAGLTQSNSNVTLSYTVGEAVVGLMTAGGNQLGNGYYPALDLQTLSIENNILDAQIKVYPNPTTFVLYVSHPEVPAFNIQILDLNGKLIYSGIINRDEPLDVSNFSQGMYLITIENNETNKKNTYKIIKK